MSKLLNKVSISVVSIATVLSLSGAAAVLPTSVHGALTSTQVSAIISLLQSFGADATTIANVQASLTGGTPVTPATPVSSSVPASLLSSGDLTVGSTGAVVKDLQMFLNAAGYTVATSGAGSVGMESTYFGNATKAALAKFQVAMGISPATGYFGSITRAKLASMGSTPVTPGTPVVIPSGSDMAVSLAAMTTGALIQSQALGNLAMFTFTNKTSSEAVVKTLSFNRTGVSNDTSLANVYLYEGGKRLSDAASVSQGVINFNTPAGIFTVPAMSAKTITVRADIAASTNGQIVGVTLASVVASVAVSGTPVVGPTQSIAAATLAGANFGSSTTPSAASIDPQDGYVMWQNTLSVTTRALNLSSIAFRQIGSVNASDLRNFKLFVDGVQVGTTVSALDSMNYVTFDMTGNPVKLATGNRVIKLVGDIVGGSNRNFTFSLRQVGDVMLVDSELGQPVLSQANSTSFSARETGQQSISQGTISITKKASSLSGNVTKDSTNVVLGSFEVKAAGESMKVENLRVGIVSGTALVGNLRNGALFVDGAQVGSTVNLATTTGATQYTEISLGSSLIVTPGTPRTLEIRADVYDNDGTNSIAAGTTLTARILAGVSNVQRMTSLNYTINTLVDANQLTVTEGSLTASKNATYSDAQTTVVPRTAFKLGSWNLVAGDSEGITLNTIYVNIRQNGTTDALVADMNDIFVKYGSKTSSVKSSVSATSSWSINEALAANANIPVEVFVNLNSGILSASTTVATLYVEGTTAASAQSKNSAYVTGQTLTVAAGSIASSFINDSSVAERILVGATSGNKVASFKFVATNDSYTITDIALKVGDANAAGTISKLTLKASGMTDTDVLFNGLIASSTGLSISVPANDVSGKVVDIYVTTNSVGAGAATSSYTSLGLTLEGFKHINSAGVQAEDATDRVANAMYVAKSVPTISATKVTGTLEAGTSKSIASFTVTADPKGTIEWSKVVISVGKTAALTMGATSTMKLYDSNNTEIVGTFATTTGSLLGGLDSLGGLTSGKLVFAPTTPESISTSKTYVLKTTIGGIASGYNYISTSIENLTATHSAGAAEATASVAAGDSSVSFVWSDLSSQSHTTSTADWFNDYKVKSLPVDTGSLSVNI